MSIDESEAHQVFTAEEGAVRQAARPARVTADRQRQCPACSELVPEGEMSKSAGWFCSACDFPLFWAPTTWVVDDTPDDDDGSGPDGLDPTLRRRPGTDGRSVVGGKPCPACAERNEPTNDFCLRCGSPMELVAVAPAPVVEPVLEVGPTEPQPPRWLVLLIVVVAVLLVIAIVALIAA